MRKPMLALLASFGLSGCLSVGDVAPMATTLVAGNTISERSNSALASISTQSGIYKTKLASVSSGETFNLYFNALAATGAVGSALFDASAGTLKAWAFATGIGTVADRSGQLKPLHGAYETAVAGFSCVSGRASVFAAPSANDDWTTLGRAAALETLVRSAEAGFASGAYKSDNPPGKALSDLLPAAKTLAAKAHAARGAMQKAPGVILETGRLIDGVAQAAERDNAINVAALVSAIRALEAEVEPPKGTPTADEAADAGDEAAMAMFELAEKATGSGELTHLGKMVAEMGAIDAVLQKVDYEDAAKQVARCAAPAV